jgi:hypothetical protein
MVTEDDKKQAGGGVVDHLQAPRKKKKDYVILAFGAQFSRDLADAIENHVKINFRGLTTIRPKNASELSKLFSRQVVLLAIDDGFAGISENVATVRVLKDKRNKVTTPVMFFTENPDDLIRAYHDKLQVYQEVDTYISYRNVSTNSILAKISKGLSEKNVRKSRRYSVDIPVTYFHLTKNKEFTGRLVDMRSVSRVRSIANQHSLRQIRSEPRRRFS